MTSLHAHSKEMQDLLITANIYRDVTFSIRHLSTLIKLLETDSYVQNSCSHDLKQIYVAITHMVNGKTKTQHKQAYKKNINRHKFHQTLTISLLTFQQCFVRNIICSKMIPNQKMSVQWWH